MLGTAAQMSLLSIEPEGGKLPLLVSVLLVALAYLLAHLLGDFLHRQLPWISKGMQSLRRWLLLRPVQAVFPFDVLESPAELRRWLITKQRLTMVGEYTSRARRAKKGLG